MARMMLAWLVAAVVVLALWLAPLAAGKDFKPGDIRVCAGAKCLPLDDRRALDALSAFYYSAKLSPRSETAPAARAPYVELRFRNGYITGIAAGLRYDHFLSYGVNLDQFVARTWYAIPLRASAAIRRLAAKLAPPALPSDILGKSH